MHRNISRAYYALMAEHHRARAAHMKILARGDAMLERKLRRAKADDEGPIEEVVTNEERLSATQRRRVYGLSSYGRKIEKLVDALLKLQETSDALEREGTNKTGTVGVIAEI
jgi:hypothetical protein